MNLKYKIKKILKWDISELITYRINQKRNLVIYY